MIQKYKFTITGEIDLDINPQSESIAKAVIENKLWSKGIVVEYEADLPTTSYEGGNQIKKYSLVYKKLKVEKINLCL